MAKETTRRALIAGAGLAAAAALAHCGSAPARAAAGTSPRLARLIALQGRAWTAYDRYTDDVEEPTIDAYYAALKGYTPEPEPPHQETATTFVNVHGNNVRLSTAEPGNVITSRRFVSDPAWATMGDADWRQARRENAAAADARDAIIAAQEARKQAHDDAVRARLGLYAIEARSLALSDREYALWEAAISEPAHRLADIVAKLDMNDRLGRVDNDRVLTALAADVRRLTGGQA